MKEWKEYKLNDICTVVSSKRIFAEQYVNEGIPFYRQKEIIELHSKQPISEPLYISNEVFSEMKKKTGVPKKGDILLTAVGVTLGIPFLVNNEEFYFKDGNLIWLKNFSENIDSSFLYYWLDSKFGWESIYMRAIGSAQPALTIDLVKKYKMLFPPLPTQQKIASILSAYDNLIQNYKKQIEALQTAASELYKEWFVRFRFPGYQTTKFENGIPEGWKVKKLGTLANISTGKCNREDAEDDGIYPLFDRSQEIKKSNEWIKDCEAIIVPGEGTSFIPRYYKGKFNLHQRCYCVEPKYPDFGKFLFYVLMLNRKYFLSVATGATVPSLRYNNFASMKFILPEISLCNNFNKIANDIFAKLDNLQQQITNLTQQRDLLLPRLMSGKLEV